MTLEGVATAARAVAAEGTTPSANTILRYLKARGDRVSKRTVLKLMKMLPPIAPAVPAEAVPAPVVAVPQPSAPVPPVLNDGFDATPWEHGRRGPAPCGGAGVGRP